MDASAWIILQLADSAFPAGGFAHSGGLEALWQAGELAAHRDPAALDRYCDELIVQTTHGALPFVGAAHREPAALLAIDAAARATLWSHVAARASRAAGRGMLDAAARAFGGAELVAARAALSRGDLEGHGAPVYGFVTQKLGVPLDEALGSYLHLTLRAALSAAVRMGIVGPFEAQAIHRGKHAALGHGLEAARALGVADVAQTAPLPEIFQGMHDRLYSRLFRS